MSENYDFKEIVNRVNLFMKPIRTSGILRSFNAVNIQPKSFNLLSNSILKQYEQVTKSIRPVVTKQTLSNFAKINSSLSGIPTKQLERIFPYSLQINPGLYTEILKQQKLFAKKMSGWSDYFKIAREEIDQKYLDLVPVVNCLKNCGWVVTPFLEMDVLFTLKGKSRKYCNDFMANYYTKNNYKNFFYEFNAILDDFIDMDFDAGYLEQLKLMRKLVSEDFENYKVLISTAVSILEFKYIEKLGSVNTDDVLHYVDIKNYFKRHNNDRRSALDYLTFVSLLGMLQKFYKGEKFSVGVEHTNLTRHTVQHGRFDPARFQETDFIKIILMIVATRFNIDIDYIV